MMKPGFLFATAALALPAPPAPRAEAAQASTPPALSWPVACQVGASCEIQHYVDHDPSAGAKDQTCGTRTYDGHNGIDIRLPDMAVQRRGVAVLAAAGGTVLRTRDGVADVSVTASAGGPNAVRDTECGNGLVIAHAGGWETQYCHMAKGSLVVKPGQTVVAGARLGLVGLSGATEFPHLHFTVREAGAVVDPFAYGAAPSACSGGRSLWRQTPGYQARVVLNVGFSTGPLTMAGLEDGGIASPNAAAPALVAYVRAVGLKAGDVQAVSIRGPDGKVAVQNALEPLPRNQAQNLMFAGTRRPAQGWGQGRYEVTYTVSNAGQVVLSRRFGLSLK